jgi:beta-N-acetylhexosaminidase
MRRQRQYITIALLTFSTIAMLVLGLVIITSLHNTTVTPQLFTPPGSTEAALNMNSPPAMPQSSTPTVPVTIEPAFPTSIYYSEPTIPAPSPTSLSVSDPWVEQHLANLSLADKIGQMIMMGISGQGYSEDSCQMILEISPGSIVYVGSNVVSPDQLRQFSADLQACNAKTAGAIPLWIAMDHEGQYVFRFDYGAAEFPAAMAIGATGNPALAYQVALAGGQELAYSGVNMVLGPVADLLTNLDSDVVSIRSYGSDPQNAGEFVTQMILGYQAAGLVPVLKHFPGHGGAAADSHYTLPVDPAGMDALRSSYLVPFQSGIEVGAQVVMFSHVSFPSIDTSGLPASLSPAIYSLLREGLNFQGVALTDSLGMGAVTDQYSIPEAALQAVRAGTDMLLITSPEIALQTRDLLLNKVRSNELSEDLVNAAVRHILTVKAANGQTDYPQSQPITLDWNGNTSLAFQAGYQAVTLLRNTTELLPLPGSHVLLIGPIDGWGMYPILQETMVNHGYKVEIVRYSGPWNGPVAETGYLTSMPTYSANFDVTVVLTWQSHLNRLLFNDDFQANLVNNLLATDRPVVVVALKSPVDILDFSSAPTYLMTFGTTKGQLQALADILVGITQPTRQNPLQGLP